jgi:hypothetical protein
MHYCTVVKGAVCSSFEMVGKTDITSFPRPFASIMVLLSIVLSGGRIGRRRKSRDRKCTTLSLHNHNSTNYSSVLVMTGWTTNCQCMWMYHFTLFRWPRSYLHVNCQIVQPIRHCQSSSNPASRPLCNMVAPLVPEVLMIAFLLPFG